MQRHAWNSISGLHVPVCLFQCYKHGTWSTKNCSGVGYFYPVCYYFDREQHPRSLPSPERTQSLIRSWECCTSWWHRFPEWRLLASFGYCKTGGPLKSGVSINVLSWEKERMFVINCPWFPVGQQCAAVTSLPLSSVLTMSSSSTVETKSSRKLCHKTSNIITEGQHLSHRISSEEKLNINLIKSWHDRWHFALTLFTNITWRMKVNQTLEYGV